MSLAGCHNPGVPLHAQPTLPLVSGLTTELAGWPKPGPQASAPYHPLFPTALPVVKPLAFLPKPRLIVHSAQDQGASKTSQVSGLEQQRDLFCSMGLPFIHLYWLPSTFRTRQPPKHAL